LIFKIHKDYFSETETHKRFCSVKIKYMTDLLFLHSSCPRPEGKTPLRRPKRRWEDTTKMDLGEIGLEGMDWLHLTQDRDRWLVVVNMVMNPRDA
jgi:hypothetical protein